MVNKENRDSVWMFRSVLWRRWRLSKIERGSDGRLVCWAIVYHRLASEAALQGCEMATLKIPPKKIQPPVSAGYEGLLFPPEQSEKTFSNKGAPDFGDFK
jgi:hypothetical protein